MLGFVAPFSRAETAPILAMELDHQELSCAYDAADLIRSIFERLPLYLLVLIFSGLRATRQQELEQEKIKGGTNTQRWKNASFEKAR